MDSAVCFGLKDPTLNEPIRWVFKIQMLVGGKLSMSASCLHNVIRINTHGITHVLLIFVNLVADIAGGKESESV